MSSRLRRSFLYTPADRPDLMAKAPQTDADAVVFDLEDAVRPDAKADARENLRTVVPDLDARDTEVCVRINGPASDRWRDDLAAAIDAGVDTVSLPMVESPTQVRSAVETATHLTADSPEFVVLLETPEGVFAGRDIAEVCADLPSVTALTFGVGDYARSVGGVPTEERIREFLNHRIVGYAAIGNLQAISSVYPDVGDVDALRRTAERARDVGFVGQSVVHPDQVPVVNEVFTPSAAAADEARRLLDGFEAAGTGAAVVDGVFLDEALLDRYRTIVRRFESIRESSP